MLIPIGDDDRSLTGPAFVTLGILGLNVFVFFVLQEAGTNAAFTYGWSVIPQEITQSVDLTEAQQVEARGKEVTIPQAPGPSPIYLTILSAMFMHGGYAHLFGNLLYLWIFGDNVEQRMGSLGFLAFYLACGGAATVAQIALSPSGVVPNLGASGAISGVLGAYIVFFPRNRVHALFFYYIVSVPAFVAIGVWIAFQFFNGVGSVIASEATLGGVAYGAHVGGFVAGLAIAGMVRALRLGASQQTGRDVVVERYRHRHRAD
jgi:membrane associated rhomboid family serine protease